VPRYQFRNEAGQQVTLTGPRTPTVAEIRRAFELDAQRLAAEQPEDETGTGWSAAKNFGKGALELIGRPGEFVSGTIAGTLEHGLTEGLKRGARAFLEPTLANSAIEESGSRVLEEQGVLRDAPRTRALAGFAADVFTDPTSLLGAPGLIRKGLIKGAALAGKGAQAERALTATNRAWAAVTKPVAAGARRVAAQTPVVNRLMQFPELVGIKGAGPLDAQQLRLKSDAMKRAGIERSAENVDALMSSAGALTPAQREIVANDMALALDDTARTSEEAQRVFSDPQLAELAGNIQQYTNDLLRKEMAEGLVPSRFAVTLPKGLQKLLSKRFKEPGPEVLRPLPTGGYALVRGPAFREMITDYFKGTAGLPSDPEAARVAQSIERRITSWGPSKKQLYDPATFNLERVGGTKNRIKPTFSSVAKDYVPVQRRQAEGPVMFRPFSTAMNEARKRNLSLADAVALADGRTETDIQKILVRRTMSHVRASESLRYLKESFDTFKATPGRKLRKSVREELARLPGMASFVDRTLPPAVAADLEKTVARMMTAETSEGLYTRGMKLFKALATSANFPTYPIVNALGNLGNMYLAGMSAPEILSGYGKASRHLRGKGLERVTNNVRSNAVFGVKGMADADVYRLAREQNVIGRASGFAAEFGAADNVSGAGRLLSGRANPLSPDFAAYTGLRAVNQAMVEDPAKLALFVHQLKNGATADEAALTVKKFLFDYGELSEFERANLTPLVPFYTWTRKNVPLQLGSLLMRPNRLSNQDRVVSLMDEMLQDTSLFEEEGEPPLLPERLTELGTFDVGRGRGKLRLPVYDLAMPGKLLSNPWDTAVNMANPIWRTAYTALAGRNAETGEDVTTGTSKALPISLLLKQAGLPSPAITTADGAVQSRYSKALMQQIPVPTLIRQLVAEAPDEAIWSNDDRMLLNTLGLGAVEITPEIQLEAVRERTRQRRARLGQLVDRIRLEQLQEIGADLEANPPQ